MAIPYSVKFREALADRGSGTEVSYELAVGVKMPMPGMLPLALE